LLSSSPEIAMLGCKAFWKKNTLWSAAEKEDFFSKTRRARPCREAWRSEICLAKKPMVAIGNR